MPTDAEGATGPMMGGGHGGDPGSTLPGLALAQDGYRLVPEVTTLAPGPAQPYRFHILGPDGKPVKRYDQLHERELHLIVVRRDMTGFQHVHPTRAPDGTWAIPLDLRTGGSWRVFADFQPTGGPGELTLGFDLHVPGTFEVGPRPSAAGPPDPRFDVKFARSGMDLTVSVRRDGKPVEPEPYLGAKGHLVALRVGDLAYNHVHPMPAPGPAVQFMVMLPTPGTYGLFFSYQVDGVVHTGVTSVKEA